jgi:galactofuranose transport system ATP-binding protein
MNGEASAPLLCIEDLSIAFGAVKALDGAGLTLRAGEIHALMGENGAGKSTLIKTLTGVYAPDSGRLEFEGHPIAPKSPREAEAIGISTVCQEVNLVPTLSIADKVLLGRQPTRFSFSRKGEIRRLSDALTRSPSCRWVVS